MYTAAVVRHKIAFAIDCAFHERRWSYLPSVRMQKLDGIKIPLPKEFLHAICTICLFKYGREAFSFLCRKKLENSYKKKNNNRQSDNSQSPIKLKKFIYYPKKY